MSIVHASNYHIYVDESYDKLNDIVDSMNPSRVFVFVDSNTEELCLARLKEKLNSDFLSIRIPAGEKYKTIQVCNGLWESLIKNGADRKSLIINLGGGVIGDMGGFVAGTYMRGIKFIQAPTTLLSQVDASVGGKLGIDFLGYKNMVGLFLEPEAVWIDTTYLKTLPVRELKSGFAEVIKHALIRSRALWLKINSSSFDISDIEWTRIVTDNIEIKNFVVKQDYKELGLRKTLNFGHTVGHAIESHFLSTEKPLTHGEAIIIGMHCESSISFLLGHLKEDELKTIHHYLDSFYKAKIDIKSISQSLLEAMLLDKKNVNGNKRFTLLKSIGTAIFDIEVKDEVIIEALNLY